MVDLLMLLLILSLLSQLYNLSRKLLGRWITGKLLRATVFGQFAGGVDEEDSVKTVERLAQRNISSIWNYSIEQDVRYVWYRSWY